jgi:cellulose synthase operon protein YhjQ
MADRKALTDETPEDVATLYSWANLHGAKYRDFSASRAQTREKARQRVQEAIETERRRAREEAEALKNADAQKAADAAIKAEAARKQEQAAREQPQRAEYPPAQAPAPQRAVQAPGPQMAPAHPVAPAYPVQQPQLEYAYAQPPLAYVPPAVSPAYPQPAAQPAYTPPVPPPIQSQPIAQPPYPQPRSQMTYPQAPTQPPPAPVHEEPYRGREDHYLQVRHQWAPAEPREPAARPAWLNTDRADAPVQPVPQAPEDTLQASRDRLTSRWFALNGVFAAGSTATEAVPAPQVQRAPVLAVFSLAGGVGKTSLVATLGRALSARGERVLLVDTAAYGLLPFFFGARDQRPGVLRTFTAPGAGGDAPIQMITMDPETLGPETAPQETLTHEISRHARGAGRVLVDLATASGATTRRLLRMAPTVLVPVVPDLSSVVSVSSIDSFFQHNVSASGQQVRPYYILNQFDPSLPLHLDVREVLREQLGDRLLPFALRRTAAVSEALAEGMTVVDYAPSSTAAEDFGSLAGWVKSLAAPASNGYRGVRWSER